MNSPCNLESEWCHPSILGDGVEILISILKGELIKFPIKGEGT